MTWTGKRVSGQVVLNRHLLLESYMKIVEKKDHHPICHLCKMNDAMLLFKLASIKDYKDSHQFSCMIQELITDV